jgi:DeoR/GlpR family transcriptional regulator of sugar metabolism
MTIPLPDERQNAILARLQRDGRVIAADLARAFDTSEDTIRRDLRDLAAAGHCRRVYGGALPVSTATGSLTERKEQHADAKAALGRAAAALVRPGQLVCIDAGSTNLWVARSLPDDAGLRVVTNAPSIAVALEARASIEVILLGGRLDRRSGGTVGLRALRALDGLRPDLYFVGACAADPRLGLAIFDAEEAAFKRALAEASHEIAAAVTDEKLGTRAPCTVAACADLDHLVLESGRSQERWGSPFEGPAVHLASRDGAGR